MHTLASSSTLRSTSRTLVQHSRELTQLLIKRKRPSADLIFAPPTTTAAAPTSPISTSAPHSGIFQRWKHAWKSFTTGTTIAHSSSSNESSAADISHHPLNPPPFVYSREDTDLTAPLPSLHYPVVLVHGYLGYASLLKSPLSSAPMFEYFGSVRTHLTQASNGGITVITPVNPPAASIVARAKKLRQALGMSEEVMEEKKINSESTERRPVGEEDADNEHIEFRNTQGKRFHSTESQPASQQDRTSAESAATNSSTHPSTPPPPGPTIMLGGRSIDLNSYTGKFHLIAHSMGGLDSRYLISQLQSSHHSSRIASLTTIGTPHRGSPIADRILDVIDVPLSFTPDHEKLMQAMTFNKISQKVANIFQIDVSGINNLSTTAMKDFNSRIENRRDVNYFSYGGAKEFTRLSVWYLPSKWIKEYGERFCDGDGKDRAIDEICAGGPNDGLVSVGSARWGRYVGTTELDHLEQIGLGVLGDKHLPLYRQIVRNLVQVEKEAAGKKNSA